MKNDQIAALKAKETGATLEKVLTVLLCAFGASIFFTKTGISVFGLAAMSLILVWKYIIKYEQENYIPKPLFIFVALFFLDLVLSAAMSTNYRWAFSEIGKYRHILCGGLIFIAPISEDNRKKILIVFFASAALDGLAGVLQYFDVIYRAYGDRAYGYSTNPILYAADLAFICGAALMMLVIKNDIFVSLKEKYFLTGVIVLTFIGIILSQSRGVWVALIVANTITVFLYNRKKALIYGVLFIVFFIVFLSSNENLRQRASSIVTSPFTEDSNGSTGIRLELWKGAIIMFKERPFLGVGYGDFESEINRLIAENKIANIPVKLYAHNIFFQVLSTRGIIGFAILIALFSSLIIWGVRLAQGESALGGYIIILSTLLTMVGGMTENNIEIHRFLAAYAFTVGVLGSYRGRTITA